MADTTTTNQPYNFSRNSISAADYQTIKAEREEMVKKQMAASNEFMFQHYDRLLRALDVSYEKATNANIILERKARREEGKKKRASLKPAAKR
jgi:uncharacterized phage-like protein YoqJ